MAIFKNKLQEQIESLESANQSLTEQLEATKIELNSFTDQTELIATLQEQIQTLTEDSETMAQELETLQQEKVDIDLEVSQQTAEQIADVGLEPVEVIEGEEKSIIEQYAPLKGEARQEFFAKHKTEILKNTKLNLYTK